MDSDRNPMPRPIRSKDSRSRSGQVETTNGSGNCFKILEEKRIFPPPFDEGLTPPFSLSFLPLFLPLFFSFLDGRRREDLEIGLDVEGRKEGRRKAGDRGKKGEGVPLETSQSPASFDQLLPFHLSMSALSMKGCERT